MIVELKDFWKWLGISQEEYAENGIDYFEHYNRMEIDYPKYEELKKCAFEIVDKNSTSSEDIDDLITIMALDKDEQNVFDYIEKHCLEEQLVNVVNCGITHLQPEARVQLSSLLFKRKIVHYKNNLSILANDVNWRVKLRALYALECLDENSISHSESQEVLDQFWMWLGISAHNYGKYGVPQIHGREECDFPLFEKLREYARAIVDFNLLSQPKIDYLFVIMAIDNESESILEYIKSHSSEMQINKLISIGINHIQYQGRWQLAELIYERKPLNYEKYLTLLAKDVNRVVSSRAYNLLE